MGKLKKERLVASNNKIRDRVPVEGLASFSELASKHNPPPSALPDHNYGEHLPAEVLYVQAASAAEQGELGQCSFCGRKFLCSRLKKHTNICSKSQGSKRKVFDSSKARARGTDPGGSDCVSLLQNKTPRRNNWRQKHEIFIQTLRQARQVQQVLSKGGKVSDLPPLPPIENPDYVACPYCRRRFAPQVAERHVPKCKSIKSRPPQTAGPKSLIAPSVPTVTGVLAATLLLLQLPTRDRGVRSCLFLATEHTLHSILAGI
uniref:C2HC/C3H-type domain-containing protein n=1 Tax=Cairina moschata TaxID=8855 RepID=A0A8C3BSP0_CAIMO